VVYDVLGGRDGGAELYSQLAPLYSWAQDTEHAPTQGMRERRDELLAELTAHERDVAALRATELARFTQAVEAVGLPRVIVPGS